jgi:hypothetical protein
MIQHPFAVQRHVMSATRVAPGVPRSRRGGLPRLRRITIRVVAMHIPRGARCNPSPRRFRSASYSWRLALLSLASESALLMAEQIKGNSARELFDPFRESGNASAAHE